MNIPFLHSISESSMSHTDCILHGRVTSLYDYIIIIYFILKLVLQTRHLLPGNKDYITTINSTDFDIFPEMSIQIPPELIQRLSDASSASGGVRVIAYLYYEVGHLFPSGKPEEEDE